MAMNNEKKLTSMVWRHMGEAIGLCLLIVSALLYYLYHYDYLIIPLSWTWIIIHLLGLLVVSTIIGAMFGYWQAWRMKKRLDLLQESMLLMEKGNRTRAIPHIGEDEVGRLGEQLSRISKRWEEQVSSLQRLSADNAQLAEKARFSAVTEERQRLARELHDAVSQQLFAISMTATALGRTLEKDIQQSARKVSLIEEMSSVAQSEMRALLLHLRPVHLEGKRLAQGVNELLAELEAKVPIEIHCEMDEYISLGRGIEDHLFRIVQESLSNTLRHAKASKMDIRLVERNGVVQLIIRDNGIGFDLNVKKRVSYGLLSMEERVNEIGGNLQIITAPGKGTKIDIRVPIVRE